MNEFTWEIGDVRPVLLCEVCLQPFHGDDDVTFSCGVCDREGFCIDCCGIGEHDCDPAPPVAGA